MTNADAHRVRHTTWATTVRLWLELVLPTLAAQALDAGHGDRGVLMVTANTDAMALMLEASKIPNAEVFLASTTTWMPIDTFLDIIRTHDEGTDAWRRWQPALEVMDARRDVAIYLQSDPDSDPDGDTFCRLLVVPGQNVPVNWGDDSGEDGHARDDERRVLQRLHASARQDRRLDAADALQLTRAEYIRRALEQMNRETRARLRARRRRDASRKVREGSLTINAEFAAIEQDVDA
jgi:hypothetical protein